ncbi:MAG: DegV family EDD domain-containing protein [Oscillospiraceae bacterium]|nr:DegV family EDD domain-containing protein [Oscillospiraceae bacterium]
MTWNIVADSSCDIFGLDKNSDNITFAYVPFVITVDDKDYVDDDGLKVPELLRAMKESKEASHTSCPAPYSWFREFEKPGNTIAVTISGNLSGSYNSACVAKDMILEEYPDKKIGIVDSCATGPSLYLIIRKLVELIDSGYDFDAVMEKIEEFRKNSKIIFALSSYNNLIKNGRMPKVAALLAQKLNLWGVGIGSDVGKIVIKKIARGSKGALDTIVSDMQERGITKNSVIIDHCDNAEFAERLKQLILDHWPTVDVTIIPTRGLCSYYAEEHGVIVAY